MSGLHQTFLSKEQQNSSKFSETAYSVVYLGDQLKVFFASVNGLKLAFSNLASQSKCMSTKCSAEMIVTFMSDRSYKRYEYGNGNIRLGYEIFDDSDYL